MYPTLKILIITLLILLKFSSSKKKITDEEFPDENECEKVGSMLLHHILTKDPLPEQYKDVHKILKYSGTGLNDLGDYYGCSNLNYTRYYILELNLGFISQSIGFCYFKQCNQTYFQNSIDKLIKRLNSSGTFPIQKNALKVFNPDDRLTEVRNDMKVGYIITCVILFSLTAFCFCVTVANRYKKLTQFSMFNLEKNAKAIFTVRSQNKTLDHLRVFDGIRLFAALWICFGHLVVFPAAFTRNIIGLIAYAKKWYFAFLVGAYYAVDIFFFLSGFLFYFYCQDSFNKKINKVKTILAALLNRYLRLLPYMLFTVFAMTYFLPYLTHGPEYFKVNSFNNGCTKNFWIHFLYINNLNLKYEDGCAPQTWYLGCDMQFFVVSILIVFIFNNSNLWRQICFAFLMIGSIVLQMYKYIKYKYPYNDFLGQVGGSGGGGRNRNRNQERNSDDEGTDARGQNFYTTPYARIGPYILGIYFSMIFMESPLYKREYKKKNVNKEKVNNENDKDKEKDKEVVDSLLKNESGNENKKYDLIEENKDVKLKIDDEIKEKKENELIIKNEENEKKEENKENVEEEKPSIIYRMNVYLEKNNLACYILLIVGLFFFNFAFWTCTISSHYKLSVFMAAFMNTFNKLFFILGMAIILHLTFLDKFTFIKKFLSFKIMSTVSRGTYGIYMIHMYFIFLFVCSYGNFYYLKFLDYAVFIVGIFVFTWGVSFVIGLIIESPVIGLSKLFVKKRK